MGCRLPDHFLSSSLVAFKDVRRSAENGMMVIEELVNDDGEDLIILLVRDAIAAEMAVLIDPYADLEGGV